MADLVVVEGGARPDIRMLEVDEPLPLAGHLGHAVDAGDLRPHPRSTRRRSSSSTRACRPSSCSRSSGTSTTTGSPSRSTTARSTSRSGAGSRRRWARASSRRWSAPSTLDLGIDWGDVDLVVNVGAPKGASPHHAAHRPLEPPHGRALEGLSRAGEPLRDPRMPRRARRRARGGAGHAGCAPRRARRALPAHPRHGLRRAVRRGRALRRGALRGALCRTDVGGFRDASSPSSRPAATRCAPTSASPRS